MQVFSLVMDDLKVLVTCLVHAVRHLLHGWTFVLMGDEELIHFFKEMELVTPAINIATHCFC